jgi:hypothetical protein
MDISKEYIETLLGYEIDEFSIEFEEGVININVIPKKTLKKVDIDFVIKPSSDTA